MNSLSLKAKSTPLNKLVATGIEKTSFSFEIDKYQGRSFSVERFHDISLFTLAKKVPRSCANMKITAKQLGPPVDGTKALYNKQYSTGNRNFPQLVVEITLIAKRCRRTCSHISLDYLGIGMIPNAAASALPIVVSQQVFPSEKGLVRG